MVSGGPVSLGMASTRDGLPPELAVNKAHRHTIFDNHSKLRCVAAVREWDFLEEYGQMSSSLKVLLCLSQNRIHATFIHVSMDRRPGPNYWRWINAG